MLVNVFEDQEKNAIFNEKGRELMRLTQGRFRVEEDKERMDICLRGIIYKSELVELLKSINVTTITIRILEEYIARTPGVTDTSILSLALELYKMLHI